MRPFFYLEDLRLSQMTKLMSIALPVLAIKWQNNYLSTGIVHTMPVNADAMWIGTWHIKGLNATVATEIVLSRPGTKLIQAQICL